MPKQVQILALKSNDQFVGNTHHYPTFCGNGSFGLAFNECFHTCELIDMHTQKENSAVVYVFYHWILNLKP